MSHVNDSSAAVPDTASRRGAAPAPPTEERGERLVVLDKPVGMTSTYAVSRLKRLFNAKKAGHAGTLDPLASGLLPIAFGEATKTVPFVQDGAKSYRFRVRWGARTDSDDSEGQVVATSGRPAGAARHRGFAAVLRRHDPAAAALVLGH